MLAPTPPALIVEFRGDLARFQSPGHVGRVQQVRRQADALAEKAVPDRDRLQVRVRL